MNERANISILLEQAMDHYRAGDLDLANGVYDKVLAYDHHNYEALEWSGEIAIQQDNYDRAALHLGQAKKIDPIAFTDFANLGLAHYELDEPVEAVDNLLMAIQHDPDDLVAHSNLGKALYELHNAGHVADAVKFASQWAADFSHIPDARHMGPAVAGLAPPDKADEAFVTETFDDFSEDFDKKLAELGYRAPELIGAMVAADFDASVANLTILDVGCGTGLAGPYLRPYAAKLIGVDLSQKMLDKALLRGGYDALHQAELIAFLSDQTKIYNLCIAADVLCYFGALEAVFEKTYGALKAKGKFAFSLELDDAQSRYVLNASGRYAHSTPYIKDCLQSAGFTLVNFNKEILRTEYGKPVYGIVVMAQV